jgi:hypothetical protein
MDLTRSSSLVAVSRLSPFRIVHACEVGRVTVELTTILGGKAGILSAVLREKR